MSIQIFGDIKNSIYNPKFYLERKGVSGGKAFGYFIKINLLGSLIFTIAYSILIIPSFSRLISESAIDSIVNVFPQELTLTLEKGKLSTNVEEPYAIQVPLNWYKKDALRGDRPANILMIDTRTPFDIQNFQNYNTSILLTRDHFVTIKESGEISIQPLGAFPDMIVNQDKLDEWGTIIAPYLKILIPLIVLAIFVGQFLWATVVGLLMITVFSLLVWIVQKVRKIDLTYGQVFKLGLYAFTLPYLVKLISSIADLKIPWYIIGAIFIVTLLTNLSLVKKKA